MVVLELEYNKYSRNVIEVFIKSQILTIKFWGTKENKDLYNYSKKIKDTFLEPFVNLYFEKNNNTTIRKSELFTILENKDTYDMLQNTNLEELLQKLKELEFNEFINYFLK